VATPRGVSFRNINSINIAKGVLMQGFVTTYAKEMVPSAAGGVTIKSSPWACNAIGREREATILKQLKNPISKFSEKNQTNQDVEFSATQGNANTKHKLG
jgi:hypothetical protein